MISPISAVLSVPDTSRNPAASTTDAAGYAWFKMPELNRATHRKIGESGAGWTFETICRLLHHVERVGRPHAKKAAKELRRLGVGLQAIAAEAGLSENKVRRDLAKLQAIGVITVVRPNVTMVRDAFGQLTENRVGRSKASQVYLTICPEHVRVKVDQPKKAASPSRLAGLVAPVSGHPGGAIQRDFHTERTPDGGAVGIGTPPTVEASGLPAGEAGGHTAAGAGRLPAADQEGTSVVPLDAGRDEPVLPARVLRPAGKPARPQSQTRGSWQEPPRRSAADAAAEWHRRDPEAERRRAEYLAARRRAPTPLEAPESPQEPDPVVLVAPEKYDHGAALGAALKALGKKVPS